MRCRGLIEVYSETIARKVAKDLAFKLPNDTQRTTVIGKTGSGKTQSAAWILSQKDFAKKPWYTLDFKGDELLNAIQGIQHKTITDKLPKKGGGLFIMHPVPGRDDEEVEQFLWRVWERGNVGLFLDEATLLGKNSNAFKAILMQGRSKRIPVIMCTQRPTDIPRACFTESEFIYLMQLSDERDKKTVREFVPFNINKPLPQYHGYYYDGVQNEMYVMKPVPSHDEILDIFRDKLTSPREFY
jgi:hypothetical protein